MKSNRATLMSSVEGRYSGIVFRASALNEAFVRRRGIIIDDVFATYKDPEDGEPPRTWPLTKDCHVTHVTPAMFVVAEDGWRPLVAKMLFQTYSLSGVSLPSRSPTQKRVLSSF